MKNYKWVKYTLLTVLLCFFTGLSSAQEKSSEKISGLVFFDYTNTLKNAGETNNEFEISRAYFTYENKYSDNLNYKFQIDADRPAAGSRLEVFIKNAMVDWNTGYGNVTLGLQGMNMYKTQENNWGYRFIEKSSMDLYKFSASADLGIAYANKFNDDVSFSVMISNGEGYKKPESNKYKKYSANINYGEQKLASKEGYNFGGSVSIEPYKLADESEISTVFGFYGGISKGIVRAGAEFNMMSMKVLPSVTVNEQIISFYANVAVIKNFDIFGRFDLFDPNTDVSSDGTNYLIGGFNWQPTKGLSIAPNIRFKDYQAEGADSDADFKVNFQFKI